VDASYGTHNDMKSHTGGIISLGTGVVHSKSSKQRLNTKSSTEAELVGASDYITYTLWVKRFLKEQGYEVMNNIFFQDNQSAIKLEKNGRQSCGEKSRHIDIRYFFIKDTIERENIDIKYCPTEIMIADFYTKPLQGKLFKKMRDILMGLAPYPIEERVDKKPVLSHELAIGSGGTNPNQTTQTEKNKKVSKCVTWADVVISNKDNKREISGVG
jgi:hypothetical protein